MMPNNHQYLLQTVYFLISTRWAWEHLAHLSCWDNSPSHHQSRYQCSQGLAVAQTNLSQTDIRRRQNADDINRHSLDRSFSKLARWHSQELWKKWGLHASMVTLYLLTKWFVSIVSLSLLQKQTGLKEPLQYSCMNRCKLKWRFCKLRLISTRGIRKLLPSSWRNSNSWYSVPILWKLIKSTSFETNEKQKQEMKSSTRGLQK